MERVWLFWLLSLLPLLLSPHIVAELWHWDGDNELEEHAQSRLLDEETDEDSSDYDDYVDAEGKISAEEEGGEEEEATPLPPMEEFSDWSRKKLEEKAANIPKPLILLDPLTGQTAPANDPATVAAARPAEQVAAQRAVRAAQRNYASKECGAKVFLSNPEATHVNAVLKEKERDEYLLNPCKTGTAGKFFYVELCEAVHPTRFDIANFELFSSGPKEVLLHGSERYPATDWHLLGRFTVADNREIQSFHITLPAIVYLKFIKMEQLSHHGSEHFCPISLVRLFGFSMVEEYEVEESIAQSNLAIAASVVQSGNGVGDEKQTTDGASTEQKSSSPVVPSSPSVVRSVESGHWNKTPNSFPSSAATQRSDRRNQYVLYLNRLRHARSRRARQARAAAENRDRGEPPVKIETRSGHSAAETAANGAVLNGAATNSKETLLVKLANRLRVLELNVSLSTEYLSQLSRSYRAGLEDLQRLANRYATEANNTARSFSAEIALFGRRLEHLQTELTDLHQTVHLLQHKEKLLDEQMTRWFVLSGIATASALFLIFRAFKRRLLVVQDELSRLEKRYSGLPMDLSTLLHRLNPRKPSNCSTCRKPPTAGQPTPKKPDDLKSPMPQSTALEEGPSNRPANCTTAKAQNRRQLRPIQEQSLENSSETESTQQEVPPKERPAPSEIPSFHLASEPKAETTPTAPSPSPVRARTPERKEERSGEKPKSRRFPSLFSSRAYPRVVAASNKLRLLQS